MINKNKCISNDSGVKDLRPYEKCTKFGPVYLTDEELLAVILRTGTNGMDSTQLSAMILETTHCTDRLLDLAQVSLNQFMQIKGVGVVKAIQIQCICELAKRMAKQQLSERMDFSSPEAIASYYMQDMRCLDKEHMLLVMLDSKCRLIHDSVLSIGTVNASLVTPREVFAEALKFGAVSVVLLHNHPSGDATPSRNDVAVTQRILEAGNVLGIPLVDHLIIGDNTYTSLREKEFI